jgi:integrase
MAALEENGKTHRTICNKYTSIVTFLKFCGIDHKELLLKGERPRPQDEDPEAYPHEEIVRFLPAVKRYRDRTAVSAIPALKSITVSTGISISSATRSKHGLYVPELDLRTVQGWMGHHSIQQTEKYIEKGKGAYAQPVSTWRLGSIWAWLWPKACR